MAIELKFLRPLYVFLGVGWKLRFTGKGRDSYPCIEYVCPFCKKQEAWVAGSPGFKGRVPVYQCCPLAVPYPIAREEFVAHLTAKAEWSNAEQTHSAPFIDEWENVPSEYQSTAHRTKELGC